MSEVFCLIGHVYVIKFRRKFVLGVVDLVKLCGCVIEKQSHNNTTNIFSLHIVMPDKTVAETKDSIKRHIKTRSNRKYDSLLKIILTGHQYELRIPKKVFTDLAILLKAKKCKMIKKSIDEGDGEINVFITFPGGKVLAMKKIITRYAKKHSFKLG